LLLSILFGALIGLFLLGPRAKVMLFWRPQNSRVQTHKALADLTAADLKALRATLARQEAAVGPIVEGAEKQIVFSAESRPKRTALCVLYIHGFSASRQEVSPVPERIAESLHANYYGMRLTGHGIDRPGGAALGRAKANDWLFDLMEAWQVAHQLGEQVIVIATSTGATLATWLAQQPSVMPHLAATVLISPNFQAKHWAMPLFLWPWSEYWIFLLAGRDHGLVPSNEGGKKYWTYRYPITALHQVAALVKAVRQSPVEHIEVPTLFIYTDVDRVVQARYTDAVARRWGSSIKHRITPPAKPNDKNHVLTGTLVRPETTAQVSADILSFLKGLPAKPDRVGGVTTDVG
jgi:esterase/lipase